MNSLPADGQNPEYAQLYFYNIENEVKYRMDVFHDSQTDSSIDPFIVVALVQMLDESNRLEKIFRMASDRLRECDIHHLWLRLFSSWTIDARESNIPTCSQIAAIIVGNIVVENANRDVIVELKDDALQRINELHPSYMALQYPFLNPYGEDGFRLGILYRNIDVISPTIDDFVTMREYYAYRLQEREDEGDSLIYDGKLSLQFFCRSLCMYRSNSAYVGEE